MLIDFFLERGEGREREGKKHQCEREALMGYLSNAPLWGSNPDRKSNSRPFNVQDDALNHRVTPAWECYFFIVIMHFSFYLNHFSYTKHIKPIEGGVGWGGGNTSTLLKLET